MKITTILFCIIGILVSLPDKLGAATLVLDSFSDGSFDLGSGSGASAQDAITSDLVSQRTVIVIGSLENWSWESELTPPSGLLSFSASRLVAGGRPLMYSLNYTPISTFSLLGYSAFELNFSTLTGSGFLEIIASSSNSSQVVQLMVDSPGVVLYPFENMAASSLEDLTGLNVRFFPNDTGLAFQLDEIRVVPEPTGISLFALGVVWLSIYRRRKI